MLDNKIVGIGTTIVQLDIAWLAHIIVHPDFRNRGIGGRITDFLVESLKHTICRTIYLIATDLGMPIYFKAGFVVETEYLFFRDVVFMQSGDKRYIKPFDEKFLQSLLSLDYTVSGEIRSLVMDAHLQYGYVYELNNQIEGYYLPTFGDGLIIAKNPAAGIELMKMRFTKKTNACFPKDNKDAKEFLYRSNFKEFRAAKRMRLGIVRTWQPSCIYNRIGGNMG